MTPTTHRLSLERIEEAARTVDPVFLNTPQYLCEPLSDVLGTPTIVKIETLNPIRSFKGRGADYFVSQISPDAQLVCASAGNFGQAMAYSCRKRGLSLTVYAGVKANPLKLERMRSLGANVILHGEDFDAAKEEAKRYAAATGARMVEDGLESLISEGAGTMGLELLSLPEPLDTLLVPLGNGAMLAGIARIIKALRPQTRIVAVQAAGAPAMTESLRTGQVVVHERMNTIADGIGVRVPIPEALEDIHSLIDDTLLVGEEAIIEGMRLLHRHAGVVVEPSGAVGVAGVLENPQLFRGQRIGTIVCGGNLTVEGMQAWL